MGSLKSYVELNMGEKLALKWNDFHANASKSFGLLRSEDYLHDVTLVSDDYKQVTAHKLVLSASSEYFKDFFKNTKHANPFLCLDGISSSVLQNILDYIYNGEVQIYQEHLDHFLKIAQRFKLQGLQSDEIDEEDDNTHPHIDPPLRSKIKESVKEESYKPQGDHTIQLNNQYTNFSDLDQMLYEYMEKLSDGSYSCKMCSKNTVAKTHMKFHVETHISGLSFPCETCGKEFRLSDTLRKHKKIHKIK